ncbi:MAG: hypothetical protein ACRCTG_11210 [Aestuariivirga sp.]
MTDAPTLVSVRFITARSGLCGCHLVGMDYPVSPEFARQVVDVERVAEYVAGEPVSAEADSSRPSKRKR